MAKTNSLKPMPSLLYIMARIDGRKASWVDKEARHSFMSPKLTRDLGLTVGTHDHQKNPVKHF